MANTCCPTGYTFNFTYNICCNASESLPDCIAANRPGIPCHTCCPIGYFDNGTGCCPIGQSCNPTPPALQYIQCPPSTGGCCPVGSTYVNSSGQYNDPVWGMGTILNPSPETFYDSCVTIVNNGWATLTGFDPITCPCCPMGYTFSSVLGTCVRPLDLKDSQQSIPCIKCVCDTPPTPRVCEDCTNSTAHIAFSYNETTKTCVDCQKKGDFRATSNAKFNAFMPARLIDPNLNFKLK